MTTYAITGASGNLGRRAIEEVLRRGVPAADVVAVVRDRDRVAELAADGVKVREADYSRSETLAPALAGVDRLLLVSSSEADRRFAHHAAVIEAAGAGGVSRIVYTSMLKADTSANPLAGDHKETEELLRATGIPFTSLRNGWYTENYTEQIGSFLEKGEIVGAAGDGRISAATREDLAAAAATALVEDRDGDRIYELGGEDFDLAELARAISAVTGANLTYRDLPSREFVDYLRRGGHDEGTADFIAALDQSIARGELETDSEDLARLLGRPGTPLTAVIEAAVRN